MKEWWASLAQREKQLLIAAGIVLTIGILYWGIWNPLNSALESSRTKVQSQQQLLSWVKVNSAKVKQYQQRTGKKTTTSGTLTQWVNQTAKGKKVEISRMQPQGESLQLWINDVAFNDLMGWLETLHTRYGVIIENVDLSAGDEPGMVKVRRLQIGKSV